MFRINDIVVVKTAKGGEEYIVTAINGTNQIKVTSKLSNHRFSTWYNVDMFELSPFSFSPSARHSKLTNLEEVSI